MALYELAYTETEIAERFEKIDKIKDNSYPIMFKVVGANSRYYVVPSGYSWKELWELGLYRWLYIDDVEVYINGEAIGAPQEDYPIDQYWYNYVYSGDAAKFKVQFTNGTFEFPFEEGMTWFDYIGTEYSDKSGIGWHSASESTQVAYNDVELYGGNGTSEADIISSTAIYTCDTSYGDDSSSSTDEDEVELAGTWVFNDTLINNGYIDYYANFNVNFVCDGTTYELLSVYSDGIIIYVWDSDDMMGNTAYYEGSWENEAYKTITISSNLADVTNGDVLLAWLNANATKQTVPSGSV